jgi:hypothetical protein
MPHATSIVVHSADAGSRPSWQPSPSPAALSPLTHGIHLPVHPKNLELKYLKRNDAMEIGRPICARTIRRFMRDAQNSVLAAMKTLANMKRHVWH